MRKRYKVFGRGSIEFLQTDNRKVLVFLRRHEDQCIMVVANLSRFVQYVQLDLSAMNGTTPIELFGGTRFPAIGDLPYFLTLGPHAAFWFLLEPRAAEVPEGLRPEYEAPALSVSAEWDEVLHDRSREALEAALPSFLMASRWFRRKHRTIRSAMFLDHIPISQDDTLAYAVLAQVNYVHGEPETYLLPLAFAGGDKAASIRQNAPETILARIHIADVDSEGVLFEAAYDEHYAMMLLELIRKGRRIRGASGTLTASATRAFRPMLRSASSLPKPAPQATQATTQRNASVVFDQKYVLKNLRRVQGGINVEVEMARYLTERRDFAHVARVAGTIEYQRTNEEPITTAILHTYIENDGDAWGYTLDAIGDYLDDALGQLDEIEEIAPSTDDVLELADQEVPSLVARLIGSYLESARLLGRRTAQMHMVLARSEGDPAFDPEPFTDFHRRALSHAMDSAVKNALRALRRQLDDLSGDVQDRARYVLDREADMRGIARALRDRKIRAKRIRCHGYYHLRQVLFTGNDFAIVDFEGEPRRRLTERRLKNSPLRDVASMLRSFHYAASSCLLNRGPDVAVGHDEFGWLQPAALFWQLWVSAVFLKSYLETASEDGLLPESREELNLLLRAYLLDRSVYELGYELDNRPDWLRVPLDGIVRLLKKAD
jgi:maltose alpha-D-glucosyltransferase/alpha-amylase